MSGRARIIVPALLALVAVVAGTMLGGGLRFDGDPGPTRAAVASRSSAQPGGGSIPGSSSSPAAPTPVPTPTPRPEAGGTEL
jgi:hypothetical protein